MSPNMRGKRIDAVDVAVGKRIRVARIAKGISQTGLGDALGVSFQQVQKYEKGMNRVGASRLTRIASTLDVSISDLLAEPATPEGVLMFELDTPASRRMLIAFNRLDRAQRNALLRLAESMVRAAP
jgi:transcriptional regulator with XRE-family HTH domain